MDGVTKTAERNFAGYGAAVSLVGDCLEEQIIGFDGFRVVELADGEAFRLSVAPKNKFFFLLEGEGRYVVGKQQGVLSTNSVMFIGFNSSFEFYGTHACRAVMLSFNALLKENEEHLGKMKGRHGAGTPAYRPVLPLNDAIRYFGLGICEMVAREQMTPWYTDLKRRELFFLICSSYTPQEVLALFRPLFEEKNSFRNLVLHNVDNVKSIEELIDITGFCRTNFYKRFSREFGMPVHRWMQLRTAYAVRELASQPGMTVRKMRMEGGFATPSNFIRFTRQYFGMTPMELIQSCRRNRRPSVL